MSSVDVTVVMAVYNTMPYLTRALTSVVEQSIGLGRLELIAVDDGSTDGSGAELDRFADRYPGTVKVIHQANSGGPAVPSNRALEHATGRYVFFLGADDYLGAEALQRLVDAADRYGSDVTLGRLVGVNGRYVHQAIFARSESDVGLFDSALPWSLSNTKLFRRELIERHRLRFPEDMPMLSDQPFTIEACLRAERISVLADYEYYYAVRRLDASNITFLPRREELLRCTTSLMDFVAELVEPGKQRDALIVRHFSWEVAKLLRRDLLSQDREVQQRIHAGVRALAERYLTDEVSRQLNVYERLQIRLAQHASLDDLLDLIRYDIERGDPSIVVENGRWYASYPWFRDASRKMPDDWFDVTDNAVNWLAKFETTAVAWESGVGRRTLTVTARSPVRDLAGQCAGQVRMTAGKLTGSMVEMVPDRAGGTVVKFHFGVDQLVAGTPAVGAVHPVVTHVSAMDGTGMSPLRTRGLRLAGRAVHRYAGRFYVVTPATSYNGRLVIAVTPITLRRVINRLRHRRRQGGKGQ